MKLSNLKISDEDQRVAEAKIIEGSVSRASHLCFLFAIAFGIYGITSYEFIQAHDPSITLFGNVWPRLFFNTLPFALIGLFFRKSHSYSELKIWIWAIALPLVFAAACLIHVWPLMWAGSPELYLYVHSANVFILTAALVVVAPPPKIIICQVVGFIGLFIVPISFIFLKTGSLELIRFAVGDFAIVIPISAFMAYSIHTLRLKIAYFDIQLKQIAAPFLGATLTDAIYNQKSELLDNRFTEGIVAQIDIRGYTDFYRDNGHEVVRQFMTSYHKMINQIVGRNGGYWHKSVGDAHLISFGVMEDDSELKSVLGDDSELEAATLRRKRFTIETAFLAIEEMAKAFDELKIEMDVDDSVGLGIGMSSGEVEIRVQGDDEFRKELDIDGEAVIRAARLEEYSKVIRKAVAPESSIITVSPELAVFVEHDPSFYRWDITNTNLKVRSFPELKYVFYCPFAGNPAAKRRNKMAA